MIKQKEYIPIPFAALLVGLVYTNTPIIFTKREYPAFFDDIKGFVDHIKNTFDFVDVDGSIETREFRLSISNRKIEKARNYLKKYANNIIRDRITGSLEQLPSWETQKNKFVKNVGKGNSLGAYKLYSVDNIQVILVGCILNLVHVNSIRYTLESPLYHDYINELENIDTDACLGSYAVQISANLDIKRLINKLTGQVDNTGNYYSKSQRELLNLIKDRKAEAMCHIKTTEIEDIYEIAGENIPHKITENVRKLNKKYSAEHGKNILGKRKKGDSYYPIL